MNIDRTLPERGFTLVELLITLSLMGLIGGAIGTAMSGGLRATKAVARELPGPQAAQSVLAWLSSDFESAIPSTVDTNTAPSASNAIGCTGAPESGSVANVVHFEATNPKDTTVRYSVSYRYHSTNKTLWRTFCRKGTNPSVHGEIVENVSDTTSTPASPVPTATLSTPDKKTLTLAMTVLVKQRAYPFSLSASVRTPKDPPVTVPLPGGSPGPKNACAYTAVNAPTIGRVPGPSAQRKLSGAVNFIVTTNLNTGVGSTCDDIWVRVKCKVGGACNQAADQYLQLAHPPPPVFPALPDPNEHIWSGSFTCPASATPANVFLFCDDSWKASPPSYVIEVVDGYDPVDLPFPAPLPGPTYTLTVS